MEPVPTNPAAVVGLAFGVLSLVVLVVCCPLSGLLGLALFALIAAGAFALPALVLGGVGLRVAGRTGVGRGPAVGALATGGLSLVGTALAIAVSFGVFAVLLASGGLK